MYMKADRYMKGKEYTEAYEIFSALGAYEDSPQRIREIEKYRLIDEVDKLGEEKKYDEALEKISDFGITDDTLKDLYARIEDEKTEDIKADINTLIEDGNYDEAIDKLEVSGIQDENNNLYNAIIIAKSNRYCEEKNYTASYETIMLCTDNNTIQEYRDDYSYQTACAYMKMGQLTNALNVIPYIEDSNTNKQYMLDVCEEYKDISRIWKCKEGTAKDQWSQGINEEEKVMLNLDVRVKIDVESKSIKYYIYPDSNEWFTSQEYTKSGNLLKYNDTEVVAQYVRGVSQRDYSFDYTKGVLSVIDKQKLDSGVTHTIDIKATYMMK